MSGGATEMFTRQHSPVAVRMFSSNPAALKKTKETTQKLKNKKKKRQKPKIVASVPVRKDVFNEVFCVRVRLYVV